MFDSLSRSWHLTKLSFEVLKSDKEMLLFPLLGGLFSLVFTFAILYPTLLSGLLAGQSPEALTAIQYILLFIVYLGLAFIATFFNVCTVYTTKTRFDGGDATFMDSIRFGFSKFHLIASWSLVSATVGIVMRALDHLAQRLGGAGQIILSIITSLVGMAWSIVTIFVIPAMVYRDVGPREALKLSVGALRKTWGESLIRHFGLGLMQFLFLLLGFAVFGGLGFALVSSPIALLGVVVLGIAYVIGVVLVFAVLNAVFNTALFVYAETGNTPGSFDGEVIQGAFREKTRRGLLG